MGYEKLLIGEDTKVVEFEDGLKFVLKLPGWMELERIRDRATTINTNNGQISLDQAKMKMEKLRACIKESPFPADKLEVCLAGLKPSIFNELMRAISSMEMEIANDSKN